MRQRHPLAADVLLVVLAVALAYANSLLNGFAYDDVGIIVRNPVVTGPGSAADIWMGPYWPAFGEYLGLYRPLTIASFTLQWAAFDGQPWAFHAVSVVQHAIVSLLVLALLRRLASSDAALLGALLFAVHPVHTEAVANLVGQAELVSAAAVVAACWIWLARDGARWRLPAVAALYAIGVLAKEHAIVLPALLVLLDLGTGRARDVRSYARSTAPGLVLLAGVAIGMLALRVAAIGSIVGGDAGPALPFLRGEGRLLSALRVWPEYARLMIWPWDLSSDYSPAVILPPDGWSAQVLLGALILLALIGLALTTRSRPRVGVPAGWFLIAVLPVSNLLFPIGVLLAERTLYLPSVAIAIAAAHAWDALVARSPGRVRALALAGTVVLIAFGARTALRNPAWKDSAAWARTLFIEHPESYRAQWEAAQVSMGQGDTAAAVDHFQLAYRLWPHDPGFLTAYGSFLVSIGAAPHAVPLLERARAALPFSPRTEGALGDAYVAAGMPERALESASRLEALGAAEAAATLRARSRTQFEPERIR